MIQRLVDKDDCKEECNSRCRQFWMLLSAVLLVAALAGLCWVEGSSYHKDAVAEWANGAVVKVPCDGKVERGADGRPPQAVYFEGCQAVASEPLHLGFEGFQDVLENATVPVIWQELEILHNTRRRGGGLFKWKEDGNLKASIRQTTGPVQLGPCTVSSSLQLKIPGTLQSLKEMPWQQRGEDAPLGHPGMMSSELWTFNEQSMWVHTDGDYLELSDTRVRFWAPANGLVVSMIAAVSLHGEGGCVLDTLQTGDSWMPSLSFVVAGAAPISKLMENYKNEGFNTAWARRLALWLCVFCSAFCALSPTAGCAYCGSVDNVMNIQDEYEILRKTGIRALVISALLVSVTWAGGWFGFHLGHAWAAGILLISCVGLAVVEVLMRFLCPASGGGDGSSSDENGDDFSEQELVSGM